MCREHGRLAACSTAVSVERIVAGCASDDRSKVTTKGLCSWGNRIRVGVGPILAIVSDQQATAVTPTCICHSACRLSGVAGVQLGLSIREELDDVSAKHDVDRMGLAAHRSCNELICGGGVWTGKGTLGPRGHV